MEVLGRSGLQVVHCVLAVERGASAARSSSHFLAAASTSSSSSSGDCRTRRSRLGLAGSSLPRKRNNNNNKRNTRVFSPICSSSSSLSSGSPPPKAGRRRLPSGATSATPVSSLLQEENLFSRIHTDDLEAETPALLAECSDMDFEKLLEELHLEALQSVESLGRKTLCLRSLEEDMKTWIHDRMVRDIEVPIEGGVSAEDEWSYESAASELRMQANLQAAQQLARSVDDSFDWEAEAAELHRRVYRYGGAETPEAMNSEQRLLHAWFLAQGEELDSSTRLVQDALASTAVIEPHDWQVLRGLGGGGVGEGKESETSDKPQLESVTSSRGGATSETDSISLDKSWFGIGATLAAAGFGGVQGASALDAIGSNPSISLQPNLESMEAASRAPSWLAPAILAFPVFSYFAFSFYRDRVNPSARVTDWMFSVVALVIVANIVLMATIGVRLY